MRDLLRDAVEAGTRAPYARRLLAAFEATPGPGGPAATAPAAPGPLTTREVEIFRLVAAGLSNQDIADQLVISLATVKRHIANGYTKLGVNSRTEAVARANALRLL